MKRILGVMSGAAVLVAGLAGAAMAGSARYTHSPSATTTVRGGGGTAFTGANLSTGIVILAVLFVAGVAALFVARRRTAAE
jgi:hypothetical protein